MNIQLSRGRRPTLSAVFAGTSGRPPTERRPATLSGRELRRIVAELIG